MNNIKDRIPENNYGFWVRNSTQRFDPLTGIETTFETWQAGTANMAICRVVDCENIGIDKFLSNWALIYNYCECVQVPLNGKYTLEQINKKLTQNTNEPQETDLQRENRELKLKLAEIENRLNDANIPLPKKSRKL